MNLYNAFAGNPVNYTDPFGEEMGLPNAHMIPGGGSEGSRGSFAQINAMQEMHGDPGNAVVGGIFRAFYWAGKGARDTAPVALAVGVGATVAPEATAVMLTGLAFWGIWEIINDPSILWPEGATSCLDVMAYHGGGALMLAPSGAFLGARLAYRASPPKFTKASSLSSNPEGFNISEFSSIRVLGAGGECPDLVLTPKTLPGYRGVTVGRRLTPKEMEALSAAFNKEFSLVYFPGSGKKGGGGIYKLYSGTPGTVEIPLNKGLLYWIYHTHPEGDFRVSGQDRGVLLHLFNCLESPQNSSQLVPVGGKYGGNPLRFSYGDSIDLMKYLTEKWRGVGKKDLDKFLNPKKKK